MDFSTLTGFRQGLYDCFEAASDALMNANDALLTDVSAHSFVELSLSPFFVRRWPSLYKALEEGEIDRTALRQLVASHVPLPSAGKRLVMGVDASNIVRPRSETARDRTHLHLPNLQKGKAAVTSGWSFSALVVLPEEAGSWTYPLDNQRIESAKTPAQTAAQQLSEVVPLLVAQGLDPLLTADRYYGSAAFLQQTAEIGCDKLLRIKSHRVLYGPPPPPTGRKGAPKKDGARFKCNDASTHRPPDAQWEGLDEGGHRLQVACWHPMHFRQCRSVTLSLLRVTRHAATGKKRDPRVSWFVWQSPNQHAPVLAEVSPTYRLRYSMEHGYRFGKQSLLWEQPRLRTPEQFQRWTDLVSVVCDQLVLARPLVAAQRQPWESKQRPATPQQVRRAMGRILVELGTPARPPQPRGKSPGWPIGRDRQRPDTYAVVNKGSPKPKKARRKAVSAALYNRTAWTFNSSTSTRLGGFV